ncbi:MAG: hypothetical protein GXY83_07745 [Rhodopirellula sp.]|nr:hypothetical protein [Rhodopirellula sp.]
MKYDQGIRKAAILIGALDRKSADVLLDKMDGATARLVRRAVVELGDVDSTEQRRVVDEFFQAGSGGKGKTAGVELGGRLARTLAGLDDTPDPPATQPPRAGDDTPFRFLQEAEADKLARLLAAERPQTIALVLSHLPAHRAGTVLVRLQPPLQVDVLRRLVDLEETDPSILREVEQTLESRLAELVRMQRRRVAGLSAVAGILAASDPRVGMQILDTLNAYDRRLAERLSPDRIDFEDFALLDDRSLATILAGSDPEIAILALAGAAEDLVERILRQLPQAEARNLRHRLLHLGPTRLSDVEQARVELVELARRLAAQGRIRLPQSADYAGATVAAVYEAAAA